MDRREALKKMAVGGATLVGASAVMTNLAFADSGSPGCFSAYGTAYTAASLATASVVRSGNSSNGTVTITFAAFSPTCPTGCGTPSVTYALYGTLTVGATTSNFGTGVWGALNTISSSATLPSTTTSVTFLVNVGVRVLCGTSSYICRFQTKSVSGAIAQSGTLSALPVSLPNTSTTPTAPLTGC